jgi:hypothetical protein
MAIGIPNVGGWEAFRGGRRGAVRGGGMVAGWRAAGDFLPTKYSGLTAGFRNLFSAALCVSLSGEQIGELSRKFVRLWTQNFRKIKEKPEVKLEMMRNLSKERLLTK